MKNKDLHLLHVFNAIMLERSFTRAANRLSMTQPAVSNLVSTMRQQWKDPLFIRHGRHVEPTSYALSLWSQIRNPIYELSTALESATFDPKRSQREFRVAMADIVIELLWPQLVKELEQIAPDISIFAVPYEHEKTYRDLKEAHVDIAIGSLSQHDRSLRSIWLFQGGFCVAMKPEHSLAKKSPTINSFLSARHLLVTPSGEAHDFIDAYLDKKGLERRVAVTVNQFSMVPRLLRSSDLIAVIPDLLSKDEAFAENLFLSDLPFTVDPSSLYLFWHARHDRNPGIVWIRDLISALVKKNWRSVMYDSSDG